MYYIGVILSTLWILLLSQFKWESNNKSILRVWNLILFIICALIPIINIVFAFSVTIAFLGFITIEDSIKPKNNGYISKLINWLNKEI